MDKSKYLTRIKLLPFSLFLFITGCFTSNAIEVETDKAAKHPNTYKLVFEQKEYASLNINFLSSTGLIAVSNPEQVDIIDLKSNKNIKTISSPNSMITNTMASNHGQKLLVSTDVSAQIWDAKTWKKIAQFASKNISKRSGISPDGKTLYFDGALWSINNNKNLINVVDDPVSQAYAFSPDGKYFVSAGHSSGTTLIDIDNKKETASIKKITGVSEIHYRDDGKYYAGFNANFILDKGGYFPDKIALFDNKSNRLIDSYSSKEKISCWLRTNDNKLVLSLSNGQIVFIDINLKRIKQWSVKDKINTCYCDSENQIWLGSNESGVYLIDLKTKSISHPLKGKNPISSVKVSGDKRYLGIVEEMPGESVVKVYKLN